MGGKGDAFSTSNILDDTKRLPSISPVYTTRQTELTAEKRPSGARRLIRMLTNKGDSVESDDSIQIILESSMCRVLLRVFSMSCRTQ